VNNGQFLIEKFYSFKQVIFLRGFFQIRLEEQKKSRKGQETKDDKTGIKKANCQKLIRKKDLFFRYCWKSGETNKLFINI
jgi:hypothetical protein